MVVLGISYPGAFKCLSRSGVCTGLHTHLSNTWPGMQLQWSAHSKRTRQKFPVFKYRPGTGLVLLLLHYSYHKPVTSEVLKQQLVYISQVWEAHTRSSLVWAREELIAPILQMSCYSCHISENSWEAEKRSSSSTHLKYTKDSCFVHSSISPVILSLLQKDMCKFSRPKRLRCSMLQKIAFAAN